MNVNKLLASIPYLPPHKIEVTEQGQHTVNAHMPFRREVTNLFGTVHAGALYTLAETVAGVAANNLVPASQVIPLLRQAEVKFTRRAESGMTAKAMIEAPTANRAKSAYKRDKRADVAVNVTIEDTEGEVVFAGSFDYALREITK
ncbi:MAG: DUF4442 domain-containing protein [Hyphomicrobiales bacterium]|nr:DUF4442 domain-containing protein [Hyphomicrobiales bacterium]MCP5073538.1 DUF4442 domain-containing protein [Paracoccaceae bacterium]